MSVSTVQAQKVSTLSKSDEMNVYQVIVVGSDGVETLSIASDSEESAKAAAGRYGYKTILAVAIG